MPTLSSSIVKHNVASVRDVEEALARQAMYGGDLVTNLLELSAVSEAELARLLAESHEVGAAPAGELPASGGEVLRLVPKDLARRFGLYPLEQNGDALLVAVSEPLPSEVESDLSFSLGLRIEQCIALAVRVQQALARDYGLPLEQRAERILAKLAGRPDPNPSVAPGPPSPPTPPSPPAAEQLPEPPVAARARGWAVPQGRVDLTTLTRKEPKPRRLGPYTPAMAERDLLDADDSDAVLRAFFDFASQYFEYTALFAVHGDLAEGRDAAGSGAPRARVLSLGIPLDLPSALSLAAASDRFSLLRLGAGGLDGALARDLDRRPGPQVLMLPILVRKRAVLVLYGDHGHQDVQLNGVGQVISFAPLVSNALEHLILKRKQGGSASLAPRAPVRPKNAPLPRPEERAATLASALGVEEAPPSSRPPLSTRSSSLMRPVISIGSLTRSKTPAQGTLSVTPKTPAMRASVQPPLETVAPPEEGWDFSFQNKERGTQPGVGANSTRKLELVAEALGDRASQPPAPPAEPTARAEPAAPAPLPVEPALEEVTARAASPEAPEISVATSSLEDELDLPPDSNGVPLAPASRTLAHSARPLPMPKDSVELKLPTVIVDLANDCQVLLEQLLAGSSAASPPSRCWLARFRGRSRRSYGAASATRRRARQSAAPSCAPWRALA